MRKKKPFFSFHHQSISIIKSMKCTEPSKNIVSINSRKVMVEWMDGKRYHRIIYEKKEKERKKKIMSLKGDDGEAVQAAAAAKK